MLVVRPAGPAERRDARHHDLRVDPVHAAEQQGAAILVVAVNRAEVQGRVGGTAGRVGHGDRRVVAAEVRPGDDLVHIGQGVPDQLDLAAGVVQVGVGPDAGVVGGDAVVVLVREPLQDVIGSRDLGVLSELEACLGGQQVEASTSLGAFVPVAAKQATPYGGRASPCGRLMATNELSGDAIIMVILGGTGTIIGPAIGAAVFLLLKNVLSSHTDYWLLWVGIVFILCVMFLRQGVWGWMWARIARRAS